MLSFYPVANLCRKEYRDTLEKCSFTFKSCEYSYANILAWSDIYNTRFAKSSEGYVFLLQYGGKNYYLCPVVSLDNVCAAFNEISEHEMSLGANSVNFVCLPELYAKAFEKSFPNVKISTSRATYDYIYSRQSLSEFSGKALHAKKNHRNKFFALYGDSYRYRVMTSEDVPACHKFNKEWYELNSAFSLSEERISTEKLLDNFDALGLSGGMIFVNDKLCAYTLASDNYDGSDTIIIHTEKGLYDIKGVYPTICSEFLRQSATSYEFVNREDDVGDEGLRKSKMSYNPICLEEKFTAEIIIK